MNPTETVRMVGRNLRTARKAAGLTQSQLAERAGVVQSYVGQIERSEKNVTLEVLVALCAGLGIEAAVLMQPAAEAPDAVPGNPAVLPELSRAA
jgi:transcriptional regulator with XRE-family HTH domain